MPLQAAAFNLGLLIRSRFGVGTLRSLQCLTAAAALADASARSLTAAIGRIRCILGLLLLHIGSFRPSGRLSYNKTALIRPPPLAKPTRWRATSSTAC